MRAHQQAHQRMLAAAAAATSAVAAARGGESEKPPPPKRSRSEPRKDAEGNIIPKRKYERKKPLPHRVDMDGVVQQCGIAEESEVDRRADVCGNLGLEDNEDSASSISDSAFDADD